MTSRVIGVHASSETRGRWLVAAALVTLLGLLLLQLGTSRYFLGDSDYYLRDAVVLAEGAVPRSRYSLGFPVLLAPLVWLTGGSLDLLWDVAVVLTAITGVAALAVTYRLMTTYVAPVPAAVVTAVIALSQGPVIYFSHIRPEAVTMLLVAGMLVLLLQGRDVPAALIAGALVFVRIALAPVAVVLLLPLWRRQRRLALLGLALVGLAAVTHFASGPTVDASYLDIGGGLATPGGGVVDAVGRLAGRVAEYAVSYGRFGTPRLLVPFGVLSTPLGPLLALPILAAILLGWWRLVRQVPARTRRADVLHAAIASAVVYQVALLVWPIRELSAIRLLLPVLPVLALGLAALGEEVAARLRTRPRLTPAAVVVVALVVGGTLMTATVIVRDRLDQPGGKDFVAAHDRAADTLPAGAVLSFQPAATELLLDRPAYELPVDAGAATDIAESIGACIVVIDRGHMDPDVEAWVARHRGVVTGRSGDIEVVVLDRPGCG